MQLPFAHLNLRFNPFGEPTLEERASLAVVDLPDLRPRDAIQLVGDGGHGKTTHLLAFRLRHPGAVYQRLDEGQDRCVAPGNENAVFLLDEAQRLRRACLRDLLRRRGPVVLGTHVDLSDAAGRPLQTIRLTRLDLARLDRIVRRRLEWARRGPGGIPVVPERALRALLARHGADLRAIEGKLYSAVQAMRQQGRVEV